VKNENLILYKNIETITFLHIVTPDLSQ